MKNKSDKSQIYILLSELVFLLLPLIIIIIVKSYQEKFDQIFYNCEWGIMSIILFGQTIVKFSSGISNSSEKFKWQIIAFWLSLLIVVGLIPSVIILVINLLDLSRNIIVYSFQIFLFILSILCYFSIGLLGQTFMDEKN